MKNQSDQVPRHRSLPIASIELSLDASISESGLDIPRALITGVTGQDGAYLARFLLEKGYEVHGTYRRLSTPNFWRLQALDVVQRVRLIPADVTDMASLLEALSVSAPDEVYNLAAQSYVGASFDSPLLTGDVDGLGVARLLEAIRIVNPKIKLYHASTSETYGNSLSEQVPLTEDALKKPASPYAAAKLYSFSMVQIYRDGYGLFAVNGILFNHESPLRGLEFVTRKISNAVAKIKLGLQDDLRLGDLAPHRDWGYAPEYVEAMWLMLQQPEPDDFVVATGTSHSVREFVELTFELAELDAEKHVRTDSRLHRPLEVNHLIGDATKAQERLGWEPRTGLRELARIMVESDLRNWQRHLDGEVFPWDAPNYLKETEVTRRGLTV